MKRIILECAHVDTCLSDFWSGDARPHIQIAARRGMSLAEIKRELHSELNQGAVAGNDERTRDDSGDEGDAWYKAAHAAVNKLKPAKKGNRRHFMELEESTEDSDETVYAYFVFVEA